MRIPEARKKLTHGEMSELTEKALENGPFTIESITRTGDGAQVVVEWAELGKRETIEVGRIAG